MDTVNNSEEEKVAWREREILPRVHEENNGRRKRNYGRRVKEGVCNLERRRRRRQRGCLATRSHCCVDEGLQA